MDKESVAEVCIAVINSFDALLHQLQVTEQGVLADESLVAWMAQEHGSALRQRPARDYAIQAIKQLEYFPEQQPREILVRPGIIGASRETLITLNNLNAAKDDFKAAMQQLKTVKLADYSEHLTAQINDRLNKRPESSQRCLRRLGLSRLHLKQCYRKLPILSSAPHKVSWTWANTRSIKRITVAEAEQRLLKRGQDAGIQYQLQLLAALPSAEPLAIVQELAPHMRANIVYQNTEGELARQMVKGPVPLFFPATEETPLPQLKAPKSKHDPVGERSRRSDIKLEDKPYLPAIRAHRYR